MAVAFIVADFRQKYFQTAASLTTCIYDSIAHADWPACARAMLDIQLTRARRHTIIYSTVLHACTCSYGVEGTVH